MAERRMFAKSIVQSSRFLKMPVSSRELYFQLGMSADDDGIVEAWNIMRLTNAHEDDLRVLVSKGYIQILDTEDMITYLTDWETNNQIRKDRYRKGLYKDLKIKVLSGLLPDDNQVTTICQPSDNQMATEVSIGKVSIDKDNNNNTQEPKEKDQEAEELFERLWNLYPRKKGKADVSKTNKLALLKVGEEEMIRAIDRYKKCIEGKDIEYVLYGGRFFKKSYIDYLDENFYQEDSRIVKNNEGDRESV